MAEKIANKTGQNINIGALIKTAVITGTTDSANGTIKLFNGKKAILAAANISGTYYAIIPYISSSGNTFAIVISYASNGYSQVKGTSVTLSVSYIDLEA